MRVERFSLFFGPLLVKVRRGETDYGIGPIPLGGYVKITGMNPNEDIPEDVRPRAYYNQPPWKRIVVILAGPTVNLLIAFGIVWVLLLSHGQTVATNRFVVAGVQAGTPAATALRPHDQLLAVDGRPPPRADHAGAARSRRASRPARPRPRTGWWRRSDRARAAAPRRSRRRSAG